MENKEQEISKVEDKVESKNEDVARSEFILNILILSVIGLTFCTFLINLADLFRKPAPVVSAGIIFVILLFFIFVDSPVFCKYRRVDIEVDFECKAAE